MKKKRMICPKCDGDGKICTKEPRLYDYHNGLYTEAEYGECPVCKGHRIVEKIVKIKYKPVK